VLRDTAPTIRTPLATPPIPFHFERSDSEEDENKEDVDVLEFT
jgi:hypothetical protein